MNPHLETVLTIGLFLLGSYFLKLFFGFYNFESLIFGFLTIILHKIIVLAAREQKNTP